MNTSKLVDKQTFLYTLVRSTSDRHFLEADLGGPAAVSSSRACIGGKYVWAQVLVQSRSSCIRIEKFLKSNKQDQVAIKNHRHLRNLTSNMYRCLKNEYFQNRICLIAIGTLLSNFGQLVAKIKDFPRR